MNEETKHAPIYPVNFAGYWALLDEPYYEGRNILDMENFGDGAEINAKRLAEIWNALVSVPDPAGFMTCQLKIASDNIKLLDERNELRSKVAALTIERDAAVLETLKRVRFSFELQSDMSTRCHGYSRLVEMIEKFENQ